MNKKVIVYILLPIIIVLVATSCDNKQLLDTTYNFNYGIIRLQDGTVIEGKVQSWRDFEDGDQLQVKMDNVTYLVHSFNCTLISK